MTVEVERLKRAIRKGRWPLGIYLGLVWLVFAGLLVWQTWMGG